jgi:hypothetical protein
VNSSAWVIPIIYCTLREHIHSQTLNFRFIISQTESSYTWKIFLQQWRWWNMVSINLLRHCDSKPADSVRYCIRSALTPLCYHKCVRSYVHLVCNFSHSTSSLHYWHLQQVILLHTVHFLQPPDFLCKLPRRCTVVCVCVCVARGRKCQHISTE